MPKLYRLHDLEPDGVIETKVSEAIDWNKKGFGIFWSVNEFNGSRKIKNLKYINAWAVDLDFGTKQEMIFKLRRGLVPSLIIETKRGFHAYWKAKDAKAEHWNAIVLDRLVNFYGADKNARDLARILRAPNFYHMKDPSNPFLIKEFFRHDVGYTESQMAMFYNLKAEKEKKYVHDKIKRELKIFGDNFWDRIWNLDCEYALEKLSGHDIVGNEIFTFKNNSTGTKNIFVNGKSTSCWIDRDGRIGSLSKGGPTIVFWLHWYGHSWEKIVKTVKEIFPEIENKKNE